MLGDETAISRYFARNRERRGIDALSDGLVALASGDPKTALKKTAKAERLLIRVPPTSNLTFQVLGAAMLRRSLRGTVLSAEELAPALPFAELPGSSWAGLAVRAAFVRSLGLEGRDDEADERQHEDDERHRVQQDADPPVTQFPGERLDRDVGGGQQQPGRDGTQHAGRLGHCLLYPSPSPRDRTRSRMPSSA